MVVRGFARCGPSLPVHSPMDEATALLSLLLLPPLPLLSTKRLHPTTYNTGEAMNGPLDTTFPDTPRSILRASSRTNMMNSSNQLLQQQSSLQFGADEKGGHNNRDWQGYVDLQRAPRVDTRAMPHATPQQPFTAGGVGGSRRSSSVSVLRPADDAAKERFASPPSVQRGPIGGGSLMSLKDRPAHLMDHQAFLEMKRVQYQRRLEAEERGEVYRGEQPYSQDFVNTLPNMYADPRNPATNQPIPLDFESRTHDVLRGRPQVVGTREEIAWITPPPIPAPVGWSGFWDLCAGHEGVLQVMALSGVNPDNSPSLTQHFMYPDLISCLQRLQYGTYCIHYQRGEPPHERYFYLKSLPLGNRSQFAPFLCWSIHRHSHNATDAIPLCNVMWVTQGIDSSEVMQKYWIGGNFMHGPFVGKRRAECLIHGAFTVWVYDGKKLHGIDILCTDPLVFTMWMKVLEDFAQLNAALDVTGNVRAMQKDLEMSKSKGDLAGRENRKKKKLTIFEDSDY